jgi:hypothetical protein
VREYQAATDLGGTDWPWCAGFFHWAYLQAGAVQPYRSASVPKLLGWYTHRKRVVQPDQVRPGDAVIYDWQRDGTPDHIGLFRRWMTPAHTDFEAVEGNTAVGNNSNGGEVMVRLRYVKDVAAFVRPVGSRVPVGTKFDPVTGEAHRSLPPVSGGWCAVVTALSTSSRPTDVCKCGTPTVAVPYIFRGSRRDYLACTRCDDTKLWPVFCLVSPKVPKE